MSAAECQLCNFIGRETLQYTHPVFSCGNNAFLLLLVVFVTCVPLESSDESSLTTCFIQKVPLEVIVQYLKDKKKTLLKIHTDHNCRRKLHSNPI